MSPERSKSHPARARAAAFNVRSNTARSSAAPGANLWDFMAITKALADENRVRMLLALRGRELCLCQLMELVGLAASTASKHMSILRQARLVEGRKDGRWMYYRLPGRESSAAVRHVLKWVQESLAGDDRVLGDAERLEEILAMGLERLCGRPGPGEGCAPPAKKGCRSCRDDSR